MLLNEEYFDRQYYCQKELKMGESLVKNGKGNVMLIPIKTLEEEVFHFDIRETLIKNNCLFFKKTKTVVMDSRLRKG